MKNYLLQQKFVILPHVLALLLFELYIISGVNAQTPGNCDFYPGDYSDIGIIGHSMPGTWRPFSDDSPWNTPIPEDAATHPDSKEIIATMVKEAVNIRFANTYNLPLWIVNSDNLPYHFADSPYPFDTWDQNYDGKTEAGVPIDSSIWGEQTEDGHICIIDPFKMLAWEMSRFKGIKNGVIDCSTFNIWDLTDTGVGDPNEGRRWKARGGRGSGFPVLAGQIRPEELAAGEIRHAMAFTFSMNRENYILPPGCRSDARYSGSQYPAEGMRLQLDTSLTDQDFDQWGLTREGKILARALQKYGMFNCDNGGAIALHPQLLDKTTEGNRAKWDSLFPGFYVTVRKIPTNKFRVVYTGEPVTGGKQTTVVTPLILPLGGKFTDSVTVTMSTPTPEAKICYTTDGSVPARNSTLYTGPIKLDYSATIRARAYRDGFKESGLVRMVFTRDTVSVGIREPQDMQYDLEFRSYPNPFNATTKIVCSIPQSGLVNLGIYDLCGRKIRTLREYHEAGPFSYNFESDGLPSGIYFCNLRLGENRVKKGKMLLLK
ncbi:chitobiase/beta-hexosaminidase C-terminal domain-containing protein [candidate division KSB1 bacterium]|nr:chitobiase/beta-hexosaminidase C-terminal domain-containing protein [candidate division KSB1 bacterium]